MMEIGSYEWLEFRKKRIGASDSAVILGISPFKTRFQLWEEKVFNKEVDINSSMRRGMDREEEARVYASRKLGVDLKPRMFTSIHMWKFATLDGISKDETVAVEIKWANKKVHEAAKRGEVIDYYYPQVQSQMFCTGLNEMFFLSCYKDEKVLIKCYRNDDFLDDLLEKESEFYFKNMIGMEAPELTDKDFVKSENSFLLDMLIDTEKEIDEKMKELEKEKEDVRNKWRELIQVNTITDKYKIVKSFIKGRVDYSKIEELKVIDLDKYRKEGTMTWRANKFSS